MQSYIIPVIAILLVIALIIYVVIGAGRTFRKAGEQFWYIFIPVYSSIVQARIGGKPIWWGLGAALGLIGSYNNKYSQQVNAVLVFASLVSILFSIMIGVAIAKKFHRSTLFGVFLLGIFSFIGYPILGYGKSTYDKNIPT